jgi:hypothetical protein
MLHKNVGEIPVKIAVLPSRSALSDLGLIADLFFNAPKLVLFLLEKSKKSDFYFFSLPHKA